jgi:hypothetical protein
MQQFRLIRQSSDFTAQIQRMKKTPTVCGVSHPSCCDQTGGLVKLKQIWTTVPFSIYAVVNVFNLLLNVL